MRSRLILQVLAVLVGPLTLGVGEWNEHDAHERLLLGSSVSLLVDLFEVLAKDAAANGDDQSAAGFELVDERCRQSLHKTYRNVTMISKEKIQQGNIKRTPGYKTSSFSLMVNDW